MRSQQIARRYAEALYSLSAEEDCIEEIDNDYRCTVEEIRAVPDVSRFLTHPLVARDAKISFLKEALPDVSEYLHNMFSVLVRNGREGYISMIYDEFTKLKGSVEEIAQVKVKTPLKLSTSDRKRLSTHLAERLKESVKLDEEIDKDLIGGLRIEVRGKVLDGSLRARLNKLKKVLAG